MVEELYQKTAKKCELKNQIYGKRTEFLPVGIE
jgi:hypothetical protein